VTAERIGVITVVNRGDGCGQGDEARVTVAAPASLLVPFSG
jgi:hypothetical protein